MFLLDRQAKLCSDALTARRFVVELTAEAEQRLAFELARAYVPPGGYSQHPAADRKSTRLNSSHG